MLDFQTTTGKLSSTTYPEKSRLPVVELTGHRVTVILGLYNKDKDENYLLQ